MITSLQIKNFKAWKDTGSVKLAPVTLILGTNSSGKSSLLQSLLLLKQTIAFPDRSIHLNFGGDETNDYFNFGQFEDVLRQGANPRQFSLEFAIEHIKQPNPEVGEDVTFAATYGDSNNGAVVQEVEIFGSNRRFKALRKGKGYYGLYIDDTLVSNSRDFAPERSIAFSIEAVHALGEAGALVQDISLTIRRELENIAYLGPLRRRPERDYTWNKTIPGAFGVDGHHAIDALLASAQPKNKERMQVDLVAGVSKWLNRVLKNADAAFQHFKSRYNYAA
ncbi:MAG: hypothetical protein A2087_01255 [Spirochaetes bacterium GWD1_61_31]|nr:MAG: hypothetical protein A2Y37_04905 [Spirochaetes bacterium GWB1_60_80]OHD29116.1 MAG: hypothetical protein A2004_10610 [Spirochaetes bacterium GWC1_61_12]OHD35294.1 MAG: hypothetical protein A2087_01255 [Spirochaetes bacterium GWD1_61_31]OHD60199.1 MAG: hypothetical protein A2Y32_07145 [Spirochaetes bacterium GWF1_60_12]